MFKHKYGVIMRIIEVLNYDEKILDILAKQLQ